MNPSRLAIVMVSVLFVFIAVSRAQVPTAPTDWQSAVQRQIAEQEYEVTWQTSTRVAGVEAAWQAPNRAHNLRTYFAAAGIRVAPRTEETPSWEWGLEWVSYGRGGRSWSVAPATLEAKAARVDYHRGGTEEWYENTPRGLEQGFVLAAPPEEIGGGEDGEPETLGTVAPGRGRGVPAERLIHVDLALTGTLRPVISEDGQAVDFEAPGGARVIHYAELKVTDARGNELPSWMEGFVGSTARGIRIVIDTGDAVYPITIDPLATSPAWTAESNQASARFGGSVGTAGDVNGDGYSDVIVGAWTYDNGQSDEGRAYVYLGSASGLAAAPAWTAESDRTMTYFGHSVSTAGDVNGDGYSDVIVGADFYTNTYGQQGCAYVYLGSASGLATVPAWKVEGPPQGTVFGGSVATAGDVNGDGYSDVIVGAQGFNNGQSQEGGAFLFLGSSSGLSTVPAWTAEGDQVNARFGGSVATAGDVNGDGYADVIVGAHYYDNDQMDEGRAYVYLGSASGLAPGPAWTAEAHQAGAQLGWSVATAGDVNGDGHADVVVGVPQCCGQTSQNSEGAALVYLGSASGLAAAPAWMVEGNIFGAMLGSSVAGAGDVNGDGYADVIVGANNYSNGVTNQGSAYVYLGSNSGLATAPAWTRLGSQSGAEFGTAVATAGDVNGDGFSDVLVGAPYYDNGQSDEGRAFLYLGSAWGPALTAGWTAASDQESAQFGNAVATAGDVNGDGYADLIVGAPDFDNGQTDEGRALVYLGSVSGLSVTAAWTAEGDQSSAAFGYSVATAGDVNGDGYADVIVGAQGYSNGQANEGRADVFLGSAAGPAATPAWTSEGDQVSARFGCSVATAGDVNGDGYADIFVGAHDYGNGQMQEGRAYAFHGSDSGLSTTPAWIAEGDQASADFGISVAAAGDVNADGYSDVIVGADHYSNGQVDEGRAFVYLGSASGLSATPVWTAESDQANALLGVSVGSAGDVNGDGYSDVIVGTPQYTNTGGFEGRAGVYTGSASGPAPAPAWTMYGVQPSSFFGQAVATAGDVNGDGYSDVIVGAPYYNNGQTHEGRALLYLGSAAGPAAAPGWTVESNQASAWFGASVGTAGDVNGDGFPDVVVGASGYDDGQADEGIAFLYYGNGGRGVAFLPRQRRMDDTAPIGPLGKSDSPTSFRLGLNATTPYGRGLARLEWEVKTVGNLFNGAGLQRDPGWSDTGTAGVELGSIASGLAPGDKAHWRVRILYGIATAPFQQHGRWITGWWNGAQETDLRTGPLVVADFAVTQSDREDPVLTGEETMYDIDVQNLGPDPARAQVEDTIPAGSTFVSASGSGASCVHAGGVVTCAIDPQPPGAHGSITVTVIAAPEGTATNTVRVYADGSDPVAVNDIATETTTVLVPGIGDRVWQDLDADGVQDEVEYGQVGTIVALYRQDGTFLGSTITDADGNYSFTDLTYGEFYYLRFFPPEPLVLSPLGQGGDDLADSDADPATGRTTTFQLYRGHDVSRWDVGVKWDSDGDGHTFWYGDCNDTDASIYPGAPQLCDGKNNDCNDLSWPTLPADEQDRDGDGFRYCNGECNNADPFIHPGATELCNGLDDDCDGVSDEGCDAACDFPAKSAPETDLTPGATTASAPKLIWTGSFYGAVWSDTRDGNAEIYFARYDAGLNRIGSEVRVTDDTAASQAPALTWTGMAFGIAWSDTRDGGDMEIYVALLDPTGGKTGGDVRVTNATGLSRFPRIAWSGTDYGLLWSDQRDGPLQAYFARVDAAGAVVPGSERRITTPPANVGGVHWAWNGSVYGITYNVFRDGDFEIYFQALDRYGTTVTPETRSTTSVGTSRTPSIAWDSAGRQFGISWVDNRSGSDELFFVRVTADGTKLTGDNRLAAINAPAATNHALTHSGGEFAIAWQDTRGGNTDIFFARLANDDFNVPEVRATDDPASSSGPTVEWNGFEYLVGFADTRSGFSHSYAARIGCCTVSTIGDRAWSDTDRDGIQDAGEPGVSDVLVAVYDASGVLLDFVPTAVGGGYFLSGLTCGNTYSLRFFPPPGSYFSPPHQGSDNTLDSDADPATGSTAPFVLTSPADAVSWDVGLHDCWLPDEPVFIAMVTLTTDGNAYPVIHYQDPNQPGQVTGYNVRRSSIVSPPPGTWPLVGTDVVDMDETTPNRQWIDQSGDVSPTGAWYYQVTAYSNRCAAEGPF